MITLHEGQLRHYPTIDDHRGQLYIRRTHTLVHHSPLCQHTGHFEPFIKDTPSHEEGILSTFQPPMQLTRTQQLDNDDLENDELNSTSHQIKQDALSFGDCNDPNTFY